MHFVDTNPNIINFVRYFVFFLKKKLVKKSPLWILGF